MLILLTAILLSSFSDSPEAIVSSFRPDVLFTTRRFREASDCVRAYWHSPAHARAGVLVLTEVEAATLALDSVESIVSTPALSELERQVLETYFSPFRRNCREKLQAAQRGVPRFSDPNVQDVTYLPCLAARAQLGRRPVWVLVYAWEYTPDLSRVPAERSSHGHVAVIVLDAQSGKVLANERCG